MVRTKPHILIVEDDDLSREILHLVFQRTRPHFQVAEATNGSMAYTHYQQHGADLIITNDDMPLMSGSELINLVRAAHMTTPIILLSGYEQGRTLVGDDECSVFMPKPVLINDILMAIDRLLGTPLV